jgi:Tol biopolymer transport system component/DNA-binding winged helix-turn-helix (wHTH) protein
MSNPAFQFGAFELDVEAGELYKRGVRIALQEQPFRLLRILLERAGEIVTRDELRRQLWPDGTFVDFDRGLNTAINRLREALGDTAARPRFIETVPRRGYRFIGDARDLRSQSVTDEHPEKSSPSKPQRSRAPVAAAAVIAIAALSGGAWYLAVPARSPEVEIRTIQLTSYEGNEWEPSFSPDGSQVAFAWDGGQIGRSQIYVKQLRSERLLRLSSTDADHRNPVWSPDGRWIALLRARGTAKVEVVVIPALGGPERILVEFPPPWSTSTAELRPPVGYLDWSPDGRWLAVSERNSTTTALSLISVDNAEKRTLTSPSAEFLGDFSPAFSPDGRTLAFVRSNSGMSLSEIYLLPLDDNFKPAAKPRKLPTQTCWIANPVWTQNSEEILFSCGQWGAGRRLYRFSLTAARSPSIVNSVGDNIYFIALSRSSHRLVYTQEAMDWDIWRVQIQGQDKTSGDGQNGRFISSTRTDSNPQYSPDGKRIAFESSRSGSSQIWIADEDGSNLFQVTSVAAPTNGFPRWSPDGKWIAFHSRLAPTTRASIFVVPTGGGLARQLTHESEDMAPSWSRDGRWVYFTSLRSGDPEIWKVAGSGGSAIQITKRGGHVAFEADRFLWYAKDAGQGVSLWKAPLTGGEEVLVLDQLANSSTYVATPSGIYFVTRDKMQSFSLQYFDLNSRRITPLGAVQGIPALGLTISPDRRWLLYNRMNVRNSDLMLVENFR